VSGIHALEAYTEQNGIREHDLLKVPTLNACISNACDVAQTVLLLNLRIHGYQQSRTGQGGFAGCNLESMVLWRRNAQHPHVHHENGAQNLTSSRKVIT